MATTANTTEEKALELLGAGIAQGEVALALGISDGRISQLLSDDGFISKLSEVKYKNLVKHNATDNLLDTIESKLAQKLDQCVPMLFKPTEIARTLQLVNQMKRRGVSSPDSITRAKPVVRLSISTSVVNHFQMNAAGQVISAGLVDTESGETSNVQDLVTIQSGNMKELVNAHLPQLKDESKNAMYPSGRYVLPKRLREEQQLKESDGKVYIKQQGRNKIDVLDECGFSEELITSIPPADSAGSSGASAT